MSEISRFYGIVIKMFFDDHEPTYFHVEYAEHQAVVSIETVALIGGTLPPRALGLVAEWAALRQEELREAWQRAKNLEPVDRIDPLP